MGRSKKYLENINIQYERVGEVYDHIGGKEHRCITCGRPSNSEFCSFECHEMRFY